MRSPRGARSSALKFLLGGNDAARHGWGSASTAGERWRGSPLEIATAECDLSVQQTVIVADIPVRARVPPPPSSAAHPGCGAVHAANTASMEIREGRPATRP